MEENENKLSLKKVVNIVILIVAIGCVIVAVIFMSKDKNNEIPNNTTTTTTTAIKNEGLTNLGWNNMPFAYDDGEKLYTIDTLKNFDKDNADAFLRLIPIIDTRKKTYTINDVYFRLLLINAMPYYKYYSGYREDGSISTAVPEEVNAIDLDMFEYYAQTDDVSKILKQVYNYERLLDNSDFGFAGPQECEDTHCLVTELTNDGKYIHSHYGCGSTIKTHKVLDSYTEDNDTLILNILSYATDISGVYAKTEYEIDDNYYTLTDENEDIVMNHKENLLQVKATFKKNANGNYYWVSNEVLN